MTRKYAVIAALLLMFTVAVFSQTQPTGAPQSGQKPHSAMDCQQMMQMHGKMQQDMKAMNDELDGMVARMNNAQGNQKVDAMAALLTKMVEQRKNMINKMETRHTSMMSHMGQHMQSGQSMADCPMMKGMSGGTRQQPHQH